MLGTLEDVKKHNWSQHISHLVHAYNCTKSEATGYSPYYLMFGPEARLPIDACFDITTDCEKETSHLQYVETLRKDLQKVYKLATETATKNHLRNKTGYDQHVKGQALSESYCVLLRNVGLTGKSKLQDRWKSTPCVSVKKLPNLPVYRVKPEHGSGVIKTLHRDHLLSIGYLVRMPETKNENESTNQLSQDHNM